MNEQIYIEQDKKKHTSFLDSEISIYIGKKSLVIQQQVYLWRLV